MQGPALLPDEWADYQLYKTEQELFLALIQKPTDLVTFFEFACADETWCEEHIKLIRSLLRWSTKAYYLNQLSLPLAQRVVKTIQSHLSLLSHLLYFQSALFLTVTLQIEGEDVPVNSLMFGALSPFFFRLFKVSCFDRMRNECSLTSVSLASFRLVETFILKGEVSDLWRYSFDEVLALMQRAKDWELPQLVKDCVGILQRYINQGNVLEILLQAHQDFFSEWKHACYDFFNQQGYGLRFLPGREVDLRVEVLDYKADTLELFEALAPWVTHLAFGGELSQDPLFEELVESCPKLIGMDLSGCTAYTKQFNEIPSSILELNLSGCDWLGPETLSLASRRFPGLKELHLNSNVQLTYTSWGILNRFQQLSHLYVDRCHQITDEDLRLISQACPHLVELSMDELRGVGDRGLIEVIHSCRHLTHLNSSRCPRLTDRSLVEIALRAYQLTHLTLIRCPSFSNKGLLTLIKHRRTLTYLNVAECGFSPNFLEQLRQRYPFTDLLN